MKLDKMKFAKLVAWICTQAEYHFNEADLLYLDEIIDIDTPQPPMLNPETLHMLMALMAEGTRKIEAIKQHRMMTGYGLKESKDIVEKYWISKGHYVPKDEGDILNPK